MGYKVKWVEDNLGISRKALRLFEKYGLMPKNEDNQHRDYSEDDINCIWLIRVLQGMGYTLREIADLKEAVSNDEDWEFHDSITQKIEDLEKKKADLERHLGYAKTIKLTGRFPSRPKDMGSIRFEDFQKRSVEEWNITKDPVGKHLHLVTDLGATKAPEEFTSDELGQLISALSALAEMNLSAMLATEALTEAIMQRKLLGANHQEVQLLVKLIYESQVEIDPELERMTPQQFARFYSSSYLYGDVGKMYEKRYGKDSCRFVADAIAIFGGYTDSDDPNLL